MRNNKSYRHPEDIRSYRLLPVFVCTCAVDSSLYSAICIQRSRQRWANERPALKCTIIHSAALRIIGHGSKVCCWCGLPVDGRQEQGNGVGLMCRVTDTNRATRRHKVLPCHQGVMRLFFLLCTAFRTMHRIPRHSRAPRARTSPTPSRTPLQRISPWLACGPPIWSGKGIAWCPPFGKTSTKQVKRNRNYYCL